MKIYGWLCFVMVVIGTSMVHCDNREERQEAVIAGAIAEEVIPIMIDFAVALVKKIWNSWQDKDNQDVVFMGRAFRIHTDSAHQVTVSDIATHVAVTKHSHTLQAAINSACQTLVKELLLKHIMSVDDLHLPPTMPPATHAPCVDHNGVAYCKSKVQRGYCAKGNVFYSFMTTNCLKSCNLCR